MGGWAWGERLVGVEHPADASGVRPPARPGGARWTPRAQPCSRRAAATDASRRTDLPDPRQGRRAGQRCGRVPAGGAVPRLHRSPFGEMAALRVRHLDLMRRRSVITESVTEVRGRAVFSTPKTHQSRSVPIPRFVVDDLAAHVAGRASDEFVFSAPRGGVLRARNFRRAGFEPAVAAAGLAPLTPHALRHTAASLTISQPARTSRSSRRCWAIMRVIPVKWIMGCLGIGGLRRPERCRVVERCQPRCSPGRGRRRPLREGSAAPGG